MDIATCESEARVGLNGFQIEHEALGLGNVAQGQELWSSPQASVAEGVMPCPSAIRIRHRAYAQGQLANCIPSSLWIEECQALAALAGMRR